MKNIIFIGFMGVGKGSVAREVIKHSEYIAIDTDDLIESMANKRVKKIFEDEGENYFRKLENDIANLEKHFDEKVKVETRKAKKEVVSEVLEELLGTDNIELTQDELSNIVLKKVA